MPQAIPTVQTTYPYAQKRLGFVFVLLSSLAIFLCVNSWFGVVIGSVRIPGYVLGTAIGILPCLIYGRFSHLNKVLSHSVTLTTAFLYLCIVIYAYPYAPQALQIVLKSTATLFGFVVFSLLMFITISVGGVRVLTRVFGLAFLFSLVLVMSRTDISSVFQLFDNFLQNQTVSVDTFWKQVFTGDPNYNVRTNGPVGFRNVFAASLFVLACGLALSTRIRRLLFFTTVLMIVLLNSISGLLYLVLGFIVAGFRRSRFQQLLVLFGFCIILVCSIAVVWIYSLNRNGFEYPSVLKNFLLVRSIKLENTIDGRMSQYGEGLTLIYEKPFFGHGIGETITKHGSDVFLHNGFLVSGHWGGLTLMMVFCFFYGAAVVLFLKLLAIRRLLSREGRIVVTAAAIAMLPFFVRGMISSSGIQIMDNSGILGLAFAMGVYVHVSNQARQKWRAGSRLLPEARVASSAA